MDASWKFGRDCSALFKAVESVQNSSRCAEACLDPNSCLKLVDFIVFTSNQSWFELTILGRKIKVTSFHKFFWWSFAWSQRTFVPRLWDMTAGMATLLQLRSIKQSIIMGFFSSMKLANQKNAVCNEPRFAPKFETRFLKQNLQFPCVFTHSFQRHFKRSRQKIRKLQTCAFSKGCYNNQQAQNPTSQVARSIKYIDLGGGFQTCLMFSPT